MTKIKIISCKITVEIFYLWKEYFLNSLKLNHNFLKKDQDLGFIAQGRIPNNIKIKTSVECYFPLPFIIYSI